MPGENYGVKLYNMLREPVFPKGPFGGIDLGNIGCPGSFQNGEMKSQEQGEEYIKYLLFSYFWGKSGQDE